MIVYGFWGNFNRQQEEPDNLITNLFKSKQFLISEAVVIQRTIKNGYVSTIVLLPWVLFFIMGTESRYLLANSLIDLG